MDNFERGLAGADLEDPFADGMNKIYKQLTTCILYTSGRSISRMNGETCTVSQIKKIASLLLDIHGQHEHQSLLYQDRQLEILDAYGRDTIGPLLEETAEKFTDYKKLQKELEAYQMNEEERAREISFLEFEIQEIDEAALDPAEEEELERRYRKMSNSRKIAEALNQAYQLTGYEAGAGEDVYKRQEGDAGRRNRIAGRRSGRIRSGKGQQRGCLLYTSRCV